MEDHGHGVAVATHTARESLHVLVQRRTRLRVRDVAPLDDRPVVSLGFD